MNMWDERYAGDEWVYGKEPNDFLREQAGRIPAGGRVLSLAEGEGRNAVFLASRGHRVTAVDSSVEGLAKTVRLARERGLPPDAIETIQADLATWTPPELTFEAVVAIFCHLPPTARTHAYGRAARALVPGGVFIVEAYTPAQLGFGTGGPKDRSLLMSLDELRAELGALSFEIGREVERDVIEGTLHHGRAATVQVVARR